jgi:hypothetical protein
MELVLITGPQGTGKTTAVLRILRPNENPLKTWRRGRNIEYLGRSNPSQAVFRFHAIPEATAVAGIYQYPSDEVAASGFDAMRFPGGRCETGGTDRLQPHCACAVADFILKSTATKVLVMEAATAKILSKSSIWNAILATGRLHVIELCGDASTSAARLFERDKAWCCEQARSKHGATDVVADGREVACDAVEKSVRVIATFKSKYWTRAASWVTLPPEASLDEIARTLKQTVETCRRYRRWSSP